MASKLIISLKFLEPFRLIEWMEENERKNNPAWIRGQAFARWYKRKDGKELGRPFVSGFLVRSTVIKAIEEVLCLCQGKWDGIDCCPGPFFTGNAGSKKPEHLRHRATLRWWDAENKPKFCKESGKDRKSACPLCLVLGQFDNAGKGDKSGFDVHFSNFSLGEKKNEGPWFEGPEKVGVRRVLNRVDGYSGKAQDFFKVWEIDLLDEFRGSIEIADDLPHRKEVISLLKTALSFVDRLCGAACRIAIDVEGGCDDTSGKASNNHTDAIGKAHELVTSLSCMEQTSNLAVRLRAMADAIRALRSKDPVNLTLPQERIDKEGNSTSYYLWDMPLDCSSTPRKLLGEAAKNAGGQEEWRIICEKVGQALYLESKDERSEEIFTKALPLGDTEFVKSSSTPDSYNDEATNSPAFTHEWIITGALIARTPFFIGNETKDGEHTSQRMLLDRKGRYSLPHSVLRGVLRRDLGVVSGQGCPVELGPSRPCVCKVCRLMRTVTARDSVSKLHVPPDIRHRIRRNPWTGIVDEGALFDTEVGLEGAFFPLVLRVRGRDQLDADLLKVLKWWKDGGCFLGGQTGTGKGRFELKELKIYKWGLGEKDARNAYCENIGFRGKETEINGADLPAGLKLIEDVENLLRDSASPWHKVTWKLFFEGPILTNDPIAALTRTDQEFPEASDAVFFKKTRVKEDQETTEEVFALKGEGIRGLVRTALGRNECTLTMDHEDCDCVQCRVFGSEHQAGKVRFEDMTLDTVSPDKGPEKLLDHVSVDRFYASVVEKFDDRPLVGAPGNPVVFWGTFWIHKAIESDEKACKAISNAFIDIRDGLYPVGAKGSIGYGWIKELKITDGPKWLKDALDAGKTANDVSSEPPQASEVWPSLPGPNDLPAGEEGILHPHYFMKPWEKYPKRERRPIGHDIFRDSEKKLTGRIICTLTTKTPLIVPDTENEDAFGLKEEAEGHKSHKFMRLGDAVAIPGAPIRAVVSSVFEALTNSCFRVMDQKKHLSWRMEAKPAILKDYFPGRVIGGAKKVQEMESVRLPLYDDKKETEALKSNNAVKTCLDGDEERKQKIKWALKSNETIADIAEKNIRFLQSMKDDQQRREVLSGKQEVYFKKNPVNKANPNDKIAELCSGPGSTGYIKLTGPNTANQKNAKGKPDNNFDDSWDPLEVNFRLTGRHGCRSSIKKKYPRPALVCVKNNKQYTISKRCERIFYGEKGEYAVPEKVRQQYKTILKDYKKYEGEIAKPFRTWLPNTELADGDLVYFKKTEDGISVEAIIPVCISRIADADPLAKHLPDRLRPCAHVCLEECDPCSAKTCPLPIYREGYPVRGLCPACHLFGTQMYKGRVRFGFALLEGEHKWIDQRDKDGNEKGYVTLPLLERPRPTWVMPNESSPIPGRKFYVHHDGWKTVQKGKNPIDKSDIKPDKNNCSVEALAQNNVFRFEVMYENLEKWELGLLLYSLELEQGLAHKMGRGKALGFGSVTIRVDAIEKRTGAGKWQKIGLDTVAEDETYKKYKQFLMMQGLEKLEEVFKENDKHLKWHEMRYINDLRLLLQRPSEKELNKIEVRYPTLRQNDDPDRRPGYVEIKKDGSYNANKRLTQPWDPWWQVSRAHGRTGPRHNLLGNAFPRDEVGPENNDVGSGRPENIAGGQKATKIGRIDPAVLKQRK